MNGFKIPNYFSCGAEDLLSKDYYTIAKKLIGGGKHSNSNGDNTYYDYNDEVVKTLESGNDRNEIIKRLNEKLKYAEQSNEQISKRVNNLLDKFKKSRKCTTNMFNEYNDIRGIFNSLLLPYRMQIGILSNKLKGSIDKDTWKRLSDYHSKFNSLDRQIESVSNDYNAVYGGINYIKEIIGNEKFNDLTSPNHLGKNYDETKEADARQKINEYCDTLREYCADLDDQCLKYVYGLISDADFTKISALLSQRSVDLQNKIMQNLNPIRFYVPPKTVEVPKGLQDKLGKTEKRPRYDTDLQLLNLTYKTCGETALRTNVLLSSMDKPSKAYKTLNDIKITKYPEKIDFVDTYDVNDKEIELLTEVDNTLKNDNGNDKEIVENDKGNEDDNDTDDDEDDVDNSAVVNRKDKNEELRRDEEAVVHTAEIQNKRHDEIANENEEKIRKAKEICDKHVNDMITTFNDYIRQCEEMIKSPYTQDKRPSKLANEALIKQMQMTSHRYEIENVPLGYLAPNEKEEEVASAKLTRLIEQVKKIPDHKPRQSTDPLPNPGALLPQPINNNNNIVDNVPNSVLDDVINANDDDDDDLVADAEKVKLNKRQARIAKQLEEPEALKAYKTFLFIQNRTDQLTNEMNSIIRSSDIGAKTITNDDIKDNVMLYGNYLRSYTDLKNKYNKEIEPTLVGKRKSKDSFNKLLLDTENQIKRFNGAIDKVRSKMSTTKDTALELLDNANLESVISEAGILTNNWDKLAEDADNLVGEDIPFGDYLSRIAEINSRQNALANTRTRIGNTLDSLQKGNSVVDKAKYDSAKEQLVFIDQAGRAALEKIAKANRIVEEHNKQEAKLKSQDEITTGYINDLTELNNNADAIQERVNRLSEMSPSDIQYQRGVQESFDELNKMEKRYDALYKNWSKKKILTDQKKSDAIDGYSINIGSTIGVLGDVLSGMRQKSNDNMLGKIQDVNADKEPPRKIARTDNILITHDKGTASMFDKPDNVKKAVPPKPISGPSELERAALAAAEKVTQPKHMQKQQDVVNKNDQIGAMGIQTESDIEAGSDAEADEEEPPPPKPEPKKDIPGPEVQAKPPAANIIALEDVQPESIDTTLKKALGNAASGSFWGSWTDMKPFNAKPKDFLTLEDVVKEENKSSRVAPYRLPATYPGYMRVGNTVKRSHPGRPTNLETLGVPSAAHARKLKKYGIDPKELAEMYGPSGYASSAVLGDASKRRSDPLGIRDGYHDQEYVYDPYQFIPSHSHRPRNMGNYIIEKLREGAQKTFNDEPSREKTVKEIAADEEEADKLTEQLKKMKEKEDKGDERRFKKMEDEIKQLRSSQTKGSPFSWLGKLAKGATTGLSLFADNYRPLRHKLLDYKIDSQIYGPMYNAFNKIGQWFSGSGVHKCGKHKRVKHHRKYKILGGKIIPPRQLKKMF